MSTSTPENLTPRRAQAQKRRQQKKRRRVLTALLVALLVVGLIGGATAALWSHFGPTVQQVLGLSAPPEDFEGNGHGETQVTVREGFTGTDVAVALEEAGVIKSQEAFVTLLLESYPDAIFEVGTYQLRLEMSSEAAYKAMQDKNNLVQMRVTLQEGITLDTALHRLSAATGISYDDFVAAAKDPSQYGVPKEFTTLEGFLFPATYDLQPDFTANQILQLLVDRMQQALKEHGIDAADSYKLLTMAALVQREAGQNPDDYPKIARVFYNRLDKDMLLQSDATVAYGTGRYDSVWTTPEERADKSNKYNTYAHKGLPAGPISLPGDLAIEAAKSPAKGDWLYFVTVNLSTGETAYATDLEGHEANVQKLAEWCTAHREEGGERCD